MQKFDLFRREVWIEDLILTVRKIELQRELRSGVGQPFPGKTGDARLLDYQLCRRRAQRDGG
jgi:hypothetical protein